MENPTPDIRELLHQITQMERALPHAVASILDLHSVPIDGAAHGGGGSDGTPDPVGSIVHQAIQTRGILTPLDDLAIEWAVTKGEKPKGSSSVYLASRIDWAKKQWPGYDVAEQTIRDVHARLAKITGWSADGDRHCPYCNRALTRQPDDDGLPDVWTCTSCDRAWLITTEHDGLLDTQRAMLAEQDTWVSKTQAAQILDITPHRIAVWVNRGKIDVRGGKINLKECSALLRKDTPAAA
jgi:hypothetical protein